MVGKNCKGTCFTEGCPPEKNNPMNTRDHRLHSKPCQRESIPMGSTRPFSGRQSAPWYAIPAITDRTADRVKGSAYQWGRSGRFPAARVPHGTLHPRSPLCTANPVKGRACQWGRSGRFPTARVPHGTLHPQSPIAQQTLLKGAHANGVEAAVSRPPERPMARYTRAHRSHPIRYLRKSTHGFPLI